MREIDRRAIDDLEIPGRDLMERAGAAVAAAVEELLPPGRTESSVLLLAGKGNNGGDALVAARLLARKGVRTETFLLSEALELKGDAALNLDRMVREKIPLKELLEDDGLGELGISFSKADLIVDGIFGTGFTGVPRGITAGVMKLVNQTTRAIPALHVVAIDIPSGLDGESGEVKGEAIRADRTVTMGLPKAGMVRREGLNYCGRITVADIGFPSSLIEEISTELEMVTGNELVTLLPPRLCSSHKGDYGHVLVIAGSPGMTGAAALTAWGALKAGAGLVTLGVPEGLNRVLEIKCTEVMTLPLPETSAGTLSPAAAAPIIDFCRKAGIVALGPGLSQNEETGKLVRELVRTCPVPLVIDADGLNLIAEDSSILREAPSSLVLTPHPGEMCRLAGLTKEELFTEREEIARRFAREYNLTLILKGAGTLIAPPSGPLWVNVNGNPGMATGGTGDVLTGLIAGFRAQGLKDLDASRLGVFVHGAAGDKATEKVGEISLIASDLLGEVPVILKELFARNC